MAATLLILAGILTLACLGCSIVERYQAAKWTWIAALTCFVTGLALGLAQWMASVLVIG